MSMVGEKEKKAGMVARTMEAEAALGDPFPLLHAAATADGDSARKRLAAFAIAAGNALKSCSALW